MFGSRVIFTVPLLYQQLFYCPIEPPPPPPPPEFVAAAVHTSRATVGKTLFYQAVAKPPAYVPQVVPATIEWLSQWRGPPNYNVAPAGGSPFVPKAAVLENTVTPDNWLPQWRGPPNYNPAPAGGTPFVPKEATRENTVTPDNWMQRFQAAVPHGWPTKQVMPFVPREAVLENTGSVATWLQRWQGPPRYLQELPGGAPFVPKEAVLENTVTPDTWLQPFYKAVPLPRLNISDVTYVPFAVVEDNTVTIDKWKLEWNLAAKTPKPIATQPVLGYPYESVNNTRTEWDWSISWQGPPRYWPLGKPYQPFVPKEAVRENTVTPDAWLPQWQGPPRYWPPKIAAQPFVPNAEVVDNTRFEWDWSIQWKGPPNYSPPSISASPFVPKEAVLENTVTPDAWMPRWQKAVPRPPVWVTQPFYGFPYEGIDNTRNEWDWSIAWQGPPRYLQRLQPGSPFVPKEATLENTVAPDKWLFRWQKAVPVPAVWRTQPFFGYPYAGQEIVVPYAQWWHQPLSRAAARPAVHNKPYQPFAPKAAVLENTVTPDKWLQRWQGARFRAPAFSAPTQFVPTAFAQFPITWQQALSVAPKRVKAPYQQTVRGDFAVAADNTVTIEKWLFRFRAAVPYPKPIPTQPFLGYPYEAAVAAAPINVSTTVTISQTFTRSLFYQEFARPPVPVEEAAVEPTPTPPKTWTQDDGLTVTWTQDAVATCPTDAAFQEDAFQEDAFQMVEETEEDDSCWVQDAGVAGGWTDDEPDP